MSYVPPHHHYTTEELVEAEIEDLLVDYRCAIRDDLYEYAAEVAGKLILARTHLNCIRAGIN